MEKETVDKLREYLKENAILRKNRFTINNINRHAIEFCEENDLHFIFVACKLNPTAFYAFAKYKVEGKSTEWLEKCIDIINE